MTADRNDRELDEARRRHHETVYDGESDDGGGDGGRDDDRSPVRDLGSPGDRPANVHETVDPPGTQEVPTEGNVYPSPGGLGNPGDDRSGPSPQEHGGTGPVATPDPAPAPPAGSPNAAPAAGGSQSDHGSRAEHEPKPAAVTIGHEQEEADRDAAPVRPISGGRG